MLILRAYFFIILAVFLSCAILFSLSVLRSVIVTVFLVSNEKNIESEALVASRPKTRLLQ